MLKLSICLVSNRLLFSSIYSSVRIYSLRLHKSIVKTSLGSAEGSSKSHVLLVKLLQLLELLMLHLLQKLKEKNYFSDILWKKNSGWAFLMTLESNQWSSRKCNFSNLSIRRWQNILQRCRIDHILKLTHVRILKLLLLLLDWKTARRELGCHSIKLWLVRSHFVRISENSFYNICGSCVSLWCFKNDSCWRAVFLF